MSTTAHETLLDEYVTDLVGPIIDILDKRAIPPKLRYILILGAMTEIARLSETPAKNVLALLEKMVQDGRRIQALKETEKEPS